MEWHGSWAVVTGGARGIGRCIAEALSKQGIHVVIADLDLAGAEGAAAALSGPGRGEGRVLDVSDSDAFEALVESVERELGPVDILVNNAGIMPVGGYLDTPRQTDHKQMDINLFGVSNGMRAVLPRMRARGRGHVLNLASVAGRVPCAGAAMYSATKFAVIGLTEAVRYELEGSGVRMSYVCPAFVRTELISGTPGPRWPPPLPPERVADAVVGALRTGKVDVYVPRIARLTVMLPALLPRRVFERVGRAFGMLEMFGEVDADARSAYRARNAL